MRAFTTLGLTLVRLKRLDEALTDCAAPNWHLSRRDTLMSCRCCILLACSEAMTALKDGLARHRLIATPCWLISFSRDAGVLEPREYAEQLARIAPTDQTIASLIESLRQQIKKREMR
jgi:hypothetical protein